MNHDAAKYHCCHTLYQQLMEGPLSNQNAWSEPTVDDVVNFIGYYFSIGLYLSSNLICTYSICVHIRMCTER